MLSFLSNKPARGSQAPRPSRKEVIETNRRNVRTLLKKRGVHNPHRLDDFEAVQRLAALIAKEIHNAKN